MRKFKWILLIILVAILGTAGYYGYSFYKFANDISTDDHGGDKPFTTNQNVIDKGKDYEPPKWEGKQRVNILLLGGDTRGLDSNDLPRSDSLMVASIDPVSKKAHLFSILRDTYVKIPGSGQDRINAAIAIGGPNLAMKTVSDLLGIPVQYYVYTDFEGFIALIDAINGIELDVEKNMKYSDSADGHVYDIDLKKGVQHLTGKTALQYVRFRHDALSDYSRTERQRKFLTAVAEKMQTTSSILKLPKILNAIDPYIKTNLSVTDMLKLVQLGFEAKADGIVTAQIPPPNLLQEKNVGGASVIGVNVDRLQLFIQDTFNKTEEVNAETSPTPSSSPSR
ncbi:LCP family protein [Paenibacillus eucommiae]|uniref:LCP family protein required for cell wall assembly n=1 Tax=Paenibacillus eucommiae TaxID=1355755 RepID=A0ABS4IZ07_9BACL|nr:LCP family protein [Paenibacillus eucommiae]MBP1992290.1 LCP family protein required for cell wall assembly [Paenibacillus eucommiae]